MTPLDAPPPAPRRSAVLWRELRLAMQIHGGLAGFCAVSLGVKLARLPLPSKRLRGRLYRSIFGGKYPPLDERELERPLEEFRSFNELFTRGVRRELRPVPLDPQQWTSPCDGRVQAEGVVERGTVMRVKQIDYDLRSLLPGCDPGPFEGGRFAVLFLSPSDCHRVFAPHDGTLERLIHVPGRRLLVHPPYQSAEYPVFTLNERLILQFQTPLGRCTLVMVAGWGVGHMTLPIVPKFRPRGPGITHWNPAERLAVNRGDWIATFEIGSTVVLLLEGRTGLTPKLGEGEVVTYGRPLYTVAPDASSPSPPSSPHSSSRPLDSEPAA